MPAGPLARIAVAHHAIASLHAPSAHRLGVATRTAASGIAITFDDGPHPEGTPAILDVLAAHGACATFFVVGEQVRRRPALLARMRAEGHGIALHGDRHLLQTRRRGRALERDYARGIAAIEDAIGIRPLRHRPPYGIYSPAGLVHARAHGLAPLLWSAWGKDWRRLSTPERIAANALQGTGARAGEAVAEGDVMLLHDADFYSSDKSHRRTAAALAIILSTLEARGLATVLVA
ncbi:polysaccharide deacetylase family protein [Conexibacter sp. DBS9H8]|uniref:polysaccharide deacetylase family protein n=1 Tax=Conexibacter sp. DBS9H8 TaxID=2937801 RepID=UPI002010586B|nr:polysaccharide deacetylase family protein [Conexibacter sp. DBS9H8]